jgi:hypothetical protein
MRIAAALAATLALATDAVATIVPGSGGAISNCYAVLDVEGTKALTTPGLSRARTAMRPATSTASATMSASSD